MLGPLEVTRDGERLELPQSKKARALLAYLAVTGRPRTRNQLCDMFWDVADDPRAGLRWCLSRLRRATGGDDGDDVWVADRRSVGLASDRISTDLAEISERMAAPDDLEVDELRAMADQFRGPLLEGLELPELHPVQAWLIAQRSEARQLHAEVLDLLVGRLSDPADAVPYARALVHAASHVEAWYVKLVDLLVSAGRLVEAEEQYEAGMRELEAQGAGTHALRRAWRRASADASRVEPAHERLTHPCSSSFVGRRDELDTMESLTDLLAEGRGGILTVAGEPGIGKSRLIHELAGRVRARGVRVLEGRCANAAFAIPYLPIIEALDQAASDLPEDRLEAHVCMLARIFPELAQRRGIDVDPAAADQQEQDRYALFRAVAALLDELADERGLLLLLEDVHWADTQTLLMLSYLVRLLADKPVLLVATYRDVEVSRTHPLSATLTALQREPAHTRMSLKRLELEDAAALIAELSGAEPGVVQAIFEQTEGHPLFIEEVVKNLVEEGRVGADASPLSLGLPEGVRDVIGRRLSRLSEPCNRMLACASALTGTIPWPVLVEVCDGDEDALLDHLDEALAAQVVREKPGGRGGNYEFTHALIQQALYEELSTSRRLRLHRQVGAAIERVYGNQLEPYLGELAHHYYEAAPSGDLDKLIEYTLRAGDRATRQMAFEEAAQLYERALRTLDELDLGDPRHGQLHELYGLSLSTMNQWSAARVEFERALAALPGDNVRDRARLILHTALCCFWMLDIERVRALATEALELAAPLEDPALTGAATAFLAQADTSDGEVRAGARRYQAAHELARKTSQFLVCQALQQYPMSLYWAGRFEESVSAGRNLIASARTHADGSMVMNLLAVSALSLGCAGHYRDAAAMFAEADRFGSEHRIPRLLARSACMQVGCLADLGALDQAHELGQVALEQASRAEFAPSVVSTELDLLFLAIARGELGAAETMLPGVAESVGNTMGFHGWVWSLRVALARAQMALAAGQAARAAAIGHEVIAEARRTGRVKYVVAGQRVVAAAQVAQDDPDSAVESLRAATREARSIRYPALLIQAAGDLLALADDDEVAAAAAAAVAAVEDQLDDDGLRSAFASRDAVRRIRAAAG